MLQAIILVFVLFGSYHSIKNTVILTMLKEDETNVAVFFRFLVCLLWGILYYLS